MSGNFRERPEFRRGRAGELLVARWLQDRGWYVIPSYDYAGNDGNKAPKLQGASVGFPVPDLDVAARGTRRWVEVKVKSKADYTYVTRRDEHGIEHHSDYLRVAEETGNEVWLAILETSTRELLMQSFKELGPPRRATMTGRRMAFFARDAFRVVHTFPPDALKEPA